MDPKVVVRERAYGTLAYAIRKGDLKPAKAFSCVDCGKPATCYDHRAYSEPLVVDPVCDLCNKRRGPAIDAPAREPRERRGMTAKTVVRHFGSVENAASKLGISRAAIYQWIKRKRVPPGRQAQIQIATRGRLRADHNKEKQ